MTEPTYQNITPYGYCSRCRMHKIKQDGKLICPRCDTKSTPSNKVNVVPDLGPEFYRKVKRQGADGQIYEDVILDKAKVDRALKGKPVTQQLNVNAEKIYIPKKEHEEMRQKYEEVVQYEQLKEYQETQQHTITQAWDALKKYFDNAPAKSANDFKKLQKIRKTLEKLYNQITEYQGG